MPPIAVLANKKENKQMRDTALAQQLGQYAQKALLYEVSVTPKPGLVDRANSGAHHDMDYYTFLDSAVVLQPYFVACARCGIEYQDISPTLFEALRSIGIEAEHTMLRATGGVNTHKGAIFVLGLLCAAAGHCAGKGSAEEICAIAGRIATPVLDDYHTSTTIRQSTGEILYRKIGCTGVRGEAALGFPSVCRFALPCLHDALARGASVNDAGIEALLCLIEQVEDTTMIKRCGGLYNMQLQQQYVRDVRKLCPKKSIKEVAEMIDREWSISGISAGGCADLLGATFYLLFIERAANCNEI